MLRQPRPPEQRAHAREKLQDSTRLGDVVVSAQPEAKNLISLFAARGEDQHRDVRTALAQCLQYAIAIHSRKHQVEHDEIGRPGARAIEALLAIFGDLHVVAFDLEPGAKTVGEIGVVFYDEDAGHGDSDTVGRRLARLGKG